MKTHTKNSDYIRQLIKQEFENTVNKFGKSYGFSLDDKEQIIEYFDNMDSGQIENMFINEKLKVIKQVKTVIEGNLNQLVIQRLICNFKNNKM